MTVFYLKYTDFAFFISLDTIAGMSFLFDKRTKKAMKWVWIVFAAMIIISMVFAYSGGSGVY